MAEPYEIIGTSVTGGLVAELERIFPDIARYRETFPVQKQRFPHFFVHQLSQNLQEERRNHWIVEYMINIRYHVAEDPSTVVGSLQERLDAIGLQMLSELTHITWGDMPVKVRSPRTEKVDGVLHWFGEIRVMATKPQLEKIKQETMVVNVQSIG